MGPWRSCWSSLPAPRNPAPLRLEGAPLPQPHTDDLLWLGPQRPHSGWDGRNAPSRWEAGRERCGHSEAPRWPWLVAVSTRWLKLPVIRRILRVAGARLSARGEHRVVWHLSRHPPRPGFMWLPGRGAALLAGNGVRRLLRTRLRLAPSHGVCASPQARAQDESGLALQGRAQDGHGSCRLRPTWLTLHETGTNEQAFTGWQAEPQAPDVPERASGHAAPDRLAFCWAWV